jgi:hypothetical protein
MAVYQRGSKGKEVKQIQTALKERGFYQGPLDGDFGGGTESAVILFQRSKGLTADGEVGPNTWKALFPEQTIPIPAITQKPLAFRCLALTGAFETSSPVPECFAGLSGDFDGQGISFGALQWCLGQGSLQPLLKKMNTNHASIIDDIFDSHAAEFREMLASSKDEQMEWARSIQSPKFRLHEPWQGFFKTLGRRTEYQDIQVAAAKTMFDAAIALCKDYSVKSERAVALMFDIKTQNGSISNVVKAQITNDFKRLPASAGEVERLRIIANRRAEAALAQWVEDVRKRKLTIAEGQGTVHGSRYNLADQYGIRLEVKGF